MCACAHGAVFECVFVRFGRVECVRYTQTFSDTLRIDLMVLKRTNVSTNILHIERRTCGRTFGVQLCVVGIMVRNLFSPVHASEHSFRAGVCVVVLMPLWAIVCPLICCSSKFNIAGTHIIVKCLRAPASNWFV